MATTRPTLAVRLIAGVLLAGYSAIVARLTLMPANTEARVFGLLDRVMLKVSHGRIEWAQTEVLANIALFVPVGFLLALVIGRWWLGALGCVLLSAAIEVAQARYLPSRVPSVQDVEVNSAGGLLGALLAWPVLRLTARPARPASPTRPTSSAGR